MNNDLLPKIASELGALLKRKNEAYGNSFERAGQIVEILFPDGITPSQYQDLLTIVRILDKLFRIATEKEAFSEDPWKDIAGYALLSLASEESKHEYKDSDEHP